jgi:biopolymer transport protein ExbD
MAINVGSPDGEDSELNSTINTTPLVDVMLVLLIIFLITVPVIVTVIPVALPKETVIATTTTPQNINLTVDANGQIYLGTAPITFEELLERLRTVAPMEPQPEVHIRADTNAPIGPVMGIVIACQRSSIFKVGFITEPLAPSFADRL